MKKFAEKHDLVKIAGIMVLITVLLTWVIPQGYFSGSELISNDITRIGIFDFFTYGLLGMYYFTVLVTFLFVLGGFYQVLSKTGGYQKLTANMAKTFKGKEILFTLVVSFIIAAISAVTNEYILLIAAAPFFITIMKKMGLDKITAFVTTFGSILVGALGTVYSTKIVGASVQYLSVEYSTLLWAKLLVFGLTYVIFNVFTVLHIVKHKPTKDEEIVDMFEETDVTKKDKVWPLVVILILAAIVAIMAYLPWEEVFGVTWFKTAKEVILKYEVFDSPIFGYILGNVKEFGAWDIFGIQIIMLIATLLVKWIYKINMNDFLTAFGEGFKKVGKMVILLLLTYLILEFTAMFPVIPTIVDWIISLSSKFNVLLTTISGLLTSAFTVEYSYTVNLIGTFLITKFADFTDQIALILQLTYGYVGFFIPSSAILLMGLSYLGISYKEWMKYIWKFLLIMLALIIILLVIIC